VIGHHVPSLRLFPIMLGDQPVLSESARLYDRLLAGQSFAFTDAATSSTAKSYLAEYYDRTAIPALALAQSDNQAGLLSEYQTNRIAHAAWTLTEELETVVEDELAVATETPVDGETTLLTNGVLDGLGCSVVVMGAKTRLDDAAAQMLSQALRAEGAEALSLPHRTALPQALGKRKPQALILVTLDGTPPASVDLQIRQLRRRLPGMRIGIAIWPSEPTPDARKSAADFVAHGMEAVMTEAFTKPPAKKSA
ncbi:MAG TPA: hypothetical protein PLM52_17540, partial [Tabrizicola sp.]|nr:hypothetical protein [Tabrizicola sp.]